MTDIRTVSLELLRHGPPHNQLLSPLTDYLGLCGDYGAATVKVPYEQRQFQDRLDSLRYRRVGREEEIAHRRETIERTAEEMATLLATVPGLVSELNDNAGPERSLIHLELVLSAAELAMLPFELSKVPNGCKGGEGSWLALQGVNPITVTRRIRGTGHDRHDWDRRPRILFAHARGDGLDDLAQAHLEVLVAAVRPWLKHFDSNDDAATRRELNRHIVHLPGASMERIAEACATHDFTHVHLLAHGAKDPHRAGQRFGLKLHGRGGGYEVVGGDRLANILGAAREGCHDGRPSAGPLVVTVASCDSGNVGDLVYDGASLAHELHRAGIPLVVGSQFPLSFEGSKRMTEHFYELMLCGLDPRLALQQVRGRLYALHGAEVHDWAALVAYAALPAQMEEQLRAFRFRQGRRAIDAALDRMDNLIDRLGKTTLERGEIDHAIEAVDRASRRMPEDPGYATEILGYQGAMEKRVAEAQFKAAGALDDDQEDLLGQSRERLDRARQRYHQAARESLSQPTDGRHGHKPLHWALTQHLSLSLLLGEPWDECQWQAALFSTKADLESADHQTRLWAHGSAAELWLLHFGFAERSERDPAGEAETHMEQLKRLASAYPFALYSSKRQLERYRNWWCRPAFQLDQQSQCALDELAGRLIERITDHHAAAETSSAAR